MGLRQVIVLSGLYFTSTTYVVLTSIKLFFATRLIEILDFYFTHCRLFYKTQDR